MASKKAGASEFAKRYAYLEGSRSSQIKQICDEALPSISFVRMLRESLSLSQTELATLLGVSQPNVSQMESRDDLRLSVLRRIAAARGGKVRIFIEFEDRRPVAIDA